MYLSEGLLVRWIDSAALAPEEEFVNVSGLEALLEEPLEVAEHMIDTFIQKTINPYRVTDAHATRDARPGVAGTPDLIRTRFQASGMRMTFFDSINFLLVTAELPERELRDVDDEQRYLEAMCDAVVKKKDGVREWVFDIPEAVAGARGDRIIPNVGAPALRDIQGPDDRADIVVRGGRVYFMFYRQIPQRYGFEPPDQWFSAEARAALESRR